MFRAIHLLYRSGTFLMTSLISCLYSASLCHKNNPYASCGFGCSETCNHPSGIDDCLHNCIETCPCWYGTLIEDSECVKPTSCDCYLEGVGVLEVSLYVKRANIFKQLVAIYN